MLVSLAIRDVVLIDRLDLAFAPGLSVLTGETGAGKSILLDSLGLALGARAESGLVRHGCPQLSVTASFTLPRGHPVAALLAEQGMTADDPLVLRRVVGADGRSRAFLDDQPVSVGLLRRVGESLVEIHGQFDSHALLDQATHRGVLDAFGEIAAEAGRVAGCWTAWRAAAAAREAAETELVRARAEEESLRQAAAGLAELAPRPGEEAALAERRAVMMNGEKLLEAMNAAFAALTRAEVESALQTARRALERVADKAEGRLAPVIAALGRAADEAAEAAGLLEKASGEVDLDPRHLEQVEERLFALRAAARRHAVAVDALPALRESLERRLAALETGGDAVARLAAAERAARAAFVEAARTLSRARRDAAGRLDEAVARELPPLKLDKATFRTLVEDLPEAGWSADGLDRVAFEVATNPGAAPGPLGRIASGGELARFMLALKVVLARVSAAATLVFDEVDAGIGGAVAAAVGDRLARLASGLQVLVVTHSPQVAARGDHHWRVAKRQVAGATLTTVAPLSAAERREEIARMLAGAQVTDQARAAAASLLATP